MGDLGDVLEFVDLVYFLATSDRLLTGVLPASPARKGGVKGSYTKMSVFLTGKPRPGRAGGFTPNKVLRYQILRMEFKRFLNTFLRIPCHIIKTGRSIVYRLVGYNHYLKDFFRTFQVIKALRFT